MAVPRHVEGLIPLSRRVLAAALASGREAGAPCALDATAGNGHDTLFLASQVGDAGRVWAFDVQTAALAAARARVAEAGLVERVVFVHAGHERLGEILPPDVAGRLYAATFNLGYLPGSDKKTVTHAPTTLAALEALLPLIAVHGLLCVHAYLGHSGGEAEGAAVARWFEGLPWTAWRVAGYGFSNKPANREALFLAEKIRYG